ncbi:MAG: PilW family protein [Desulfobacteria bacterium]
MCCLFKNRERGFSLIELLIAMTLGLIVLGAISSVFLTQRQTYDAQEQIADMVQTARAAMDMMSREIRMAGYNPANAGFNGITYASSQLQIQADINGDGNTSSDPNENITYTYDAKNFRIDRNTGSGGQPFADNIEAFNFVYLEADGTTEVNTFANTGNIRQIRITITARTSKIDRALGDYRRYTLTSLVTPRNLGL